jgi:hypothetical protein
MMNLSVYAFVDLDPTRATTAQINEFYERGLTAGYPDGSFRPTANITRAEFITLVNRTFEYDLIPLTLKYTDVNGSEWYAKELQKAVQKGYIAGYPDNTFRPSKKITRQEVAVVLNRIMGYKAEHYVRVTDSVQPWAMDAVNNMVYRGIMTTLEGKFRGEVPITREDTVGALLSVLHIKEAEIEAGAQVPPTTGEANLDYIYNDIKPTTEVIYALESSNRGLTRLLIEDNSYTSKLTADARSIVSDMQSTMTLYLADYTYDYEGAANLVKVKYNALTTLQQDNMEDALTVYVPVNHISTLKQFFGK